MFFDFLVTLVAGAVVIGEDCKKGSVTNTNRTIAYEFNKPYYVDGYGKKRATENNEILTERLATGYTQLVGTKTGKIYYDWYQELLDKKNKELLKKGKTKFKYVSEEDWKDHFGRRMMLRYDIEKGRPYMIIGNTDYMNIAKPRMAYAVAGWNGQPKPDLSTERELTAEEYDMYTDRETSPEFHFRSGWN